MRTICIVTTSRAEYGLLSPLLCELSDAPEARIQLVVGGTHLLAEFGYTCDEIEADGFRVDWKVPHAATETSEEAVACSTARALEGFAAAFSTLAPDIVVVLGDRIEIVAAGLAATIQRVPIAHISGGHLTEGAIDDAMRHCLTKMAHLHFTDNETYRRRIVQLGESPERVFAVGSLGVDNICRTTLVPSEQLEMELGMPLGRRSATVTYHPVTLEPDAQLGQLEEMLDALDAFPDLHLVFTMPNADMGGKEIADRIRRFVDARPERTRFVESFGRTRYLSMVAACGAVIGNSSSGIIEAPAVGTPTVNIGDRQRGRLRARSVIDCSPDKASIVQAISYALEPSFREAVRNIVHPYGDGSTARRIRHVLCEIPLQGLIRKTFHDMDLALPPRSAKPTKGGKIGFGIEAQE